MTLRRFAAARHLLISPRGDERGFVDEALSARGMSRHIAMVINHFAPAGRIVAASDLVLTVPERVALPALNSHALTMIDAPITPPGVFSTTEIIWHRRLGAHPALSWLRGVLLQLAGDAAA